MTGRAGVFLAGVLAFAVAGGAAAAAVPPPIAAAVADAGRPDADKARDADRKPAETVAFAMVKPGDKVGEFLPGGGYVTRILSKAVGARGKIYALTTDIPPPRPQQAEAFQALVAANPNVTVVKGSPLAFKPPEKLDVFWTSENYHDIALPMLGGMDRNAFNKMVFDALKSGGVYYVEDHAAAPGAGDTVSATLHRIEAATVKKEVEAAGFRLEAQSDILARPADPHTAMVFDPSVRGKTDKFVMRFRKP